MNPKTPQDLNPQLKEAYDRVMGGNFSSAAIPKTPEVSQTEQQTPVQNPALSNSAPSSTPLTPQAPTPTVNVPSPSSSPVLAKKKLKISPIIFLVVGLAFFAIYAVVWAKLFKLF